MPRRDDIESILILGAGPIVIGQACEFDYSGVQACKALKEEGYRVILVNSNPATIMTDPEFADATYIEPITPDVVARILEKERPDALLPTLGGQTALNTAMALAKDGVLDALGIEMLGAKPEVIERAEDREKFKQTMDAIGLDTPKGGFARTMDEAWAIAEEIGYPIIIRPSYTLGGTGGGVAYNPEEFERIAKAGLAASPISEILVEESVLGWKEFEMEVMRDRNDNCVIICSIENLDPMGVHTGDSITVAPAQTLTDKEYQRMRDASIAILRAIGVETGGSNVQFAVHPETGRMVAIEMNPRVSRSSALASKATGFPIAKIAAKLAVGYTLDEIPNDITGKTYAAFEPTIDYVVVKVPRFAFEKFPEADPVLTTQMKSVGEAMAIGRTFAEALGKALRSLEVGSAGLDKQAPEEDREGFLTERLATPNAERIWWVAEALRAGFSLARVQELTKMDPWFLREIARIVEMEEALRGKAPEAISRKELAEAKRLGISDARLAALAGADEAKMREVRKAKDIRPVFKRVDTCAAEFAAITPYLYSTYETECEADPTDRKKVVVLGGGPNRIGQGIEFDYCCVHAAFALKEEGIEAIMVNCNPETVSTDYDTSDRLYFEPLTLEDVLAILDVEKPDGVIVQFGGQTPLKLAGALKAAGAPILGTDPEMIDMAEDRERFQKLLMDLGLRQPENATARSEEEAVIAARKIGYPLVVRPSYVLGGRAMQIVRDERELVRYMREAVQASPEHPVLLDRFLDRAIEVDVDAVADGRRVVIGGIMEHIEEAGVHSGDSACCLPPRSLSPKMLREIEAATEKLGLALQVKGLLNIQFAVQGDALYVLEVNPRASRTVPFVSKATGIPLAKIATKVMLGHSLAELGFTEMPKMQGRWAVKEAVFPFKRFAGVDPLLGPEMKSTGEVMGIATDFATAFAKAQLAAGMRLPKQGTAFISVRDADKPEAVKIARLLAQAGFRILATAGTAKALQEAGIAAEKVAKVVDGVRPHIVDRMLAGEVQLVVNTTEGAKAIADSRAIRRAALELDIPYFTTVAGGLAAAEAIAQGCDAAASVRALQDWYRG